MGTERCIEDLVMRGCDDWIQAAEVVSVTIDLGRAHSEDEMREMSLEVIRSVVEGGLMELGDVDVIGGGGFRKWDMPIEECINRVEREWRALGRNPSLWELCWLSNTDKGNELGQRLYKQKDVT